MRTKRNKALDEPHIGEGVVSEDELGVARVARDPIEPDRRLGCRRVREIHDEVGRAIRRKPGGSGQPSGELTGELGEAHTIRPESFDDARAIRVENDTAPEELDSVIAQYDEIVLPVGCEDTTIVPAVPEDARVGEKARPKLAREALLRVPHFDAELLRTVPHERRAPPRPAHRPRWVRNRRV